LHPSGGHTALRRTGRREEDVVGVGDEPGTAAAGVGHRDLEPGKVVPADLCTREWWYFCWHLFNLNIILLSFSTLHQLFHFRTTVFSTALTALEGCKTLAAPQFNRLVAQGQPIHLHRSNQQSRF
jgi:hypothetical protein